MSTTQELRSQAIIWSGQTLSLLDQRHLPQQEIWLTCHRASDVAAAIADMAVRGAPAIGIAAAYGIALEACYLAEDASSQTLEPAFSTLAASRPTAVNLFWALEQLKQVVVRHQGAALSAALARAAEAIHRNDIEANKRLGALGATLLGDDVTIYTHCNTGALATGGHGTALGIIRSCYAQSRLVQVYAGETRPWLQGARLTAWELQQDGIPTTLVVDSAAGLLMQQGKIDAVIVGADRVAANGDTANKIGTYSLAVLADYHHIPFYVAAPASTLDSELLDGSLIPIEQRSDDEITMIKGMDIAPAGMPTYNPSFDITPAHLITAIITEHGIVSRPSPSTMAQHFREIASL